MKINSNSGFEPQIGEEINVEINNESVVLVCVEATNKYQHEQCNNCAISGIELYRPCCINIPCTPGERSDGRAVIYQIKESWKQKEK